MDIEHSKPGAGLALKQALTKKVLHEAALQIATIDANSKSITECAALAERINSAGSGLRASPLVTVFTSTVNARVMICYQPLSAVRDAIRRAGLHIHNEEVLVVSQAGDFADETEIRFDLVGYDCPVLITGIVEETVADYAEAA